MNKRLQTYEQKGFLSEKERRKSLYLCNTKNSLNSSFLILHSNAHGNMLTMPHLSSLQWSCKDELISASNGTFTSHYNYDAGGNRTRKTVVKDNIVETRYYVNGYEVYRKHTNQTLTLERKTLNIADDEKVFVRIEQKTGKNEITRYQYDNHLGSACLELDFEGSIISYEEYHPFGTTSYRSGKGETEVSLKRYKYNGKERDEETGLYAYGMRYYAAWLCRFVSVDPLQFDYPYYTPFQYAGNKPITFIDLDGAEEAKPNLLERAKGLWNYVADKINSVVNKAQSLNPFKQKETKNTEQKPIQAASSSSTQTFTIDKTALDPVEEPKTLPTNLVDHSGGLGTYSQQQQINIENIPSSHGEILPADNLTRFEMWLDSPSEGVVGAFGKIAANIGYSILNSPYSLVTGRTIGGTYLNPSEKMNAFVDFVPGLLSGGLTKTGQVIKTTKEGLQGYHEFIKEVKKLGIEFKGLNWQQKAGEAFQINKVNQQALKDADKGLQTMDVISTTKKELEK